MSNLTYEVSVALNGAALCVTLGGVHAYDAALTDQKRLVEGVKQNGFKVLLMDYRPCRIMHELEEYGRIADSYCADLPEGLPIAFVFSPRQAARVIFMTRRLEEAGRPAHGFSNVRSGLDWLQSCLDRQGELGGAPDAAVQAERARAHLRAVG